MELDPFQRLAAWTYECELWSPRSEKLGSRLWEDTRGLSISTIDNCEERRFRLRFADEVIFDVDPASKKIVISSRPNIPEISVLHLISDQILPRVVAHEGALTIHAGAVCVRDFAILVLGDSGFGKSTLVASLDNAGLNLMGDDALIISRTGSAHRAEALYPSLRLMPDSIKALFGERRSSALMAHYSEKRRMSVPFAVDASPERRPIAAIFALEAGGRDGKIRCERKSAAEACMTLIANSFELDPTDLDRATRKLAQAAALASDVPTFRLSYPRDYARLLEVHATMLAVLPLPHQVSA